MNDEKQQHAEYGDAYQGAREDLAIWKRRALDAEARLRELQEQEPVVPDGYVIVPQQMHIDAADVESICAQCGDGGHMYGDFQDMLLWVGDVSDEYGKPTHGLHVSSADYPEEGAMTLFEFAAMTPGRNVADEAPDGYVAVPFITAAQKREDA